MHNGKMGTISLTAEDRARTMVLEGIPQEDRPTAVGYFIMDTLRTFFQTGLKAGTEIRIHIGLMTPADIDTLRKSVDVYHPSLKVIAHLGEIYKLMHEVSTNDGTGGDSTE